MIRIFLLVFFVASICRADAPVFQVQPPPASLKLSAFFKKYVSANGYPICSSEHVDDYALKEAAYLINMMFSKRPDVREAMIKNGSIMIVMAHNEYTTDIPQHSQLQPKDYWDRRARGLGGEKDDPVCSCGEENLLAFPGDPYAAENILIHEFAHNIHLIGMMNIDETFDVRLQAAYDQAMAAKLWDTKYASVDSREYWAEGVQSWFNNNRPPDHDHNHVNTRAELQEYDPRLAKLCEEVFGDTQLEYTKPITRLTGHMAGYDPSKAPTFEWPERLKKANMAIQKEVAQRTKKVIVIDVRSKAEWDSGHVGQAIHIPHTEIGSRIKQVTEDKNAKIVLYCAVGGRAGKAKSVLEKMGFKNVENGGGYKDVKDRFKE